MTLQEAYKKARSCSVINDKMKLIEVFDHPDFWEFSFMPDVPEDESWMYTGVSLAYRKDTGEYINLPLPGTPDYDEEYISKGKEVDISALGA